MNTLKSNLDATDWKILGELQNDARLSYAEIGRRVGLSSPAVQERIRRLENANIIKSYRAQINYQAVGLPIMAITRLLNIQGSANINTVRDIAQTIPEVMWCYHVTGHDEYIVQIVAKTMQHLEEILHHFSDYAQLVSSVVINAPVEHSTIDLERFPHLRETDS